MAVGSRFQDEDGVVADLVQLPHLEEENEVKDVPQRRSGGVAWCRVGGTEYELAGNSRVTWTSAPAHRRGDGDRSRSARLILLGLTATIGTVCLDAVFKGRSGSARSSVFTVCLLLCGLDISPCGDLAIRQQKMRFLDRWKNAGRNNSDTDSNSASWNETVCENTFPTKRGTNRKLYITQYDLCSQHCCRTYGSSIHSLAANYSC